MLQDFIQYCSHHAAQQQQLTFLPALLSLAPLFFDVDTRLGVSYPTSDFRGGGMACWASQSTRGKGELCTVWCLRMLPVVISDTLRLWLTLIRRMSPYRCPVPEIATKHILRQFCFQVRHKTGEMAQKVLNNLPRD